MCSQNINHEGQSGARSPPCKGACGEVEGIRHRRPREEGPESLMGVAALGQGLGHMVRSGVGSLF